LHLFFEWAIHNNPPVDIEKYPKIKEHLDKYSNKLKTRSDKGKTLYNLRNCAYLDDFKEEKIMWLELTDNPKFMLDKSQKLLEMTVFFMVGKHLNYLLSLLNSKVVFWYFDLICNESGVGTNRWKKTYVEQLPIPIISSDKEMFFIEKSELMMTLNKTHQTKKQMFLKRITDNFELEKLSKKLETFYKYDFKTFVAELKKKKVNLSLVQQDEWEEYFESYQKELLELQSQIDTTDKEIDVMVYELYGLSEDEIAVVEGR